MTNYAAGTRFEHRVRDHLRENGYEVVRSAGSKTKIDLIAFKPSQLLLIQCKRNGTLPPAEWDALHTVAGWVEAIPVLAAIPTNGRGITYTRLLAPKRRGSRNQATEPFQIDIPTQAKPRTGSCCNLTETHPVHDLPAVSEQTRTFEARMLGENDG